MDQWNRTEGPEINPHTCSQLFYDKGGEKTERRKDSLFSEWCWESWTVACKSMKPEHTLTPFTKTDSKWLKDWKIRHSTIKLLEENIGKTFSDINHTNVFLGWSLKAKKAKINKWNLIKLTSSGTAKETINKWKQSTDWEKMFANDATNKGLISKILKQFLQFSIRKTKQPNQTMCRDLNRHFSKDDMQMANRNMKRCSSLLIIREMQIKPTVKYHLTPVRWSSLKSLQITNAGEGMEKRDPPTFWWECQLVQPPLKTLWRFLKKLQSCQRITQSQPWAYIQITLSILKDAHSNVHCSTIHNSQDMEAT